MILHPATWRHLWAVWVGNVVSLEVPVCMTVVSEYVVQSNPSPNCTALNTKHHRLSPTSSAIDSRWWRCFPAVTLNTSIQQLVCVHILAWFYRLSYLWISYQYLHRYTAKESCQSNTDFAFSLAKSINQTLSVREIKAVYAIVTHLETAHCWRRLVTDFNDGFINMTVKF